MVVYYIIYIYIYIYNMGYIYIYNMGFEVCGLVVPLVLFLKREARGNYIITVSQSQIWKSKNYPDFALSCCQHESSNKEWVDSLTNQHQYNRKTTNDPPHANTFLTKLSSSITTKVTKEQELVGWLMSNHSNY